MPGLILIEALSVACDVVARTKGYSIAGVSHSPRKGVQDWQIRESE